MWAMLVRSVATLYGVGRQYVFRSTSSESNRRIYVREHESYQAPNSEIDTNSVIILRGIRSISVCGTTARNEDRRVGHPKRPIHREH
jgi:hypothetical protein